MPSNNDKILIHAVGDLAVNRDDPDSIFVLSASTIKQADIAFCQVERIYAERGEFQIWGHAKMLSHPKNANAIKNAGFNVVSLAGNHCGDYGYDALFDTINTFKKLGMHVIGVGANISEARKPAIIEVKGTKIGFLAYCSILPYRYWAEDNRPGCVPMRAFTIYEQIERDQPGTPSRTYTTPHPQDLRDMKRDIEKLRKEVDIVIVSQHWGLHFIPAAIADYQIEVGHAAIDSGADLILGHHAHILKGIEIYKNKAILYSMGNFAFDTTMPKERFETPRFQELTALHPGWKYDPAYQGYEFPVDSRRTLLLKVIVSSKKIQKISFLPAFILPTAQTELLKHQDKRAQEVFEYMDWVNKQAGFDTKMLFEGDEVVIEI